jgi:hypothetical protein
LAKFDEPACAGLHCLPFGFGDLFGAALDGDDAHLGDIAHRP